MKRESGLAVSARDRRIHSICLPKATESRPRQSPEGTWVRGSTTPRRRVVSRDPKNGIRLQLEKGGSGGLRSMWHNKQTKSPRRFFLIFLIRKSLTAQRYCDILKTSTSPLMRTSFL